MKIILKKYYPFLPLILLCAFYIYKAHFTVIHDFSNYYFGAYFLKEGLFSTDIYFPYFFNKNIADLGYQNIFVSYAPNTPFLSILFYPFSWLSLTISKLIFNILSSCLFIFSLIRLANYFKLKKEYTLLLPILFFIPLKNNLLFGQVYFLLFFLLSEGFLGYQKQRYKTMATLWSLAVFLKVFPILLVGFLLFKKEFKAVKYLILGCAFLLLFSIYLNGHETWFFYFTKVLPRANNGEIAGAFVDNYQSIFMFFKRLFVFDELYNTSVITDQPNLFKALLIFIKIILIGTAYYITKNNKNHLFIFSFWLLISLLISPYGSTYSFILLIFLYFSILQYFKSKSKIFLLILLFLITNNTLIKQFEFPLNYSRLFALILLAIALIWKIKENINFKKVGMISIMLATISFVLPDTKTNSIYFTNKKLPILTYTYSIIDNKLIYKYWDENGGNSKSLNTKITSTDSTLVKILNNQVYYKNKPLTFDNADKIKPILINKNQVVFLSDSNRGIGFYELRKIMIIE